MTEEPTPPESPAHAYLQQMLQSARKHRAYHSFVAPVTPAEAGSFTVASLAMGYVLSPVAFTYGALGEILFQNLLLIWVGSLVALLVRLFIGRTSDGQQHFTWWGTAVLALPSIWLFLTVTGVDSGFGGALVSLIALAMGFVSMPYILWFMMRAAVPETTTIRSVRVVVGFWVVLCVVCAASFALGKNHHRFLYCEDFVKSGAYAPSNCVPYKPDSGTN